MQCFDKLLEDFSTAIRDGYLPKPETYEQQQVITIILREIAVREIQQTEKLVDQTNQFLMR